jgi:RNA polymerase sigma-70 factor (ECF subfamily)
MDLNDQSAIRAVLAGDTEAYKALVVRHSPMIFRVACRITGNEADADEVVQDAFLRGFQKLEFFQFQSSFGSWIYRIAANSAFDLIKRRNRQAGYYDSGEEIDPESGSQPVQVPDLAVGPERLLLSRELGSQQQHALHALTALERTAFLLRHMEDKSTTEIAAALEIAPNAAKQAVFRAVQKLRLRLRPLRENA